MAQTVCFKSLATQLSEGLNQHRIQRKCVLLIRAVNQVYVKTPPSPNRREGVFSIYLLSCSLLCNLKPCSYFPLECINLTVQTSFFPMLRLSRGCDRVLACCILSHQALFPPLYEQIRMLVKFSPVAIVFMRNMPVFDIIPQVQ